MKYYKHYLAHLVLAVGFSLHLHAQIGRRFPSEMKVIKDPATGVPLKFLTTQPRGDSKIYPTHPQWTSDGQWLIFRSHRVNGEAMAVNEKTGDIVQVSEGGYLGMLAGDPKFTIRRKLYPAPINNLPATPPCHAIAHSPKSSSPVQH